MGKRLSPLGVLLKPSVLVTEDHVGSLEHGCSILCTTTIKISIYDWVFLAQNCKKTAKKDLGLSPFKL